MSKLYQVGLSNGQTIKIPNDGSRHSYEVISRYGVQAVLQRARRTSAYIKAKTLDDSIQIREIITPDGEVITQF